MMYGLYNGYGWGSGNMMGFWGGGIMMIVFWVVIVYFLVYFIRSNKTDNTNNNKALDVLKERYAKGEIDKKEFEEKKKDLSI